MSSLLLAWNVLLAVNLAIVWSLGSDITVDNDCLWSDIEDGRFPSSGSSKDGLGRQRLLQILLRAEGDRLRRRRRQQQQQQQLLPYSPGGDIDWSTNGDSSPLEATPTGQLQRHLSLELSALLRRLCGPSSAKPTQLVTSITDDEGGISAADDLYRHLSKFPRYGLEGEGSREAEEEEEEEEELRKPEKRKRPTKSSELDPTFMLMGIGRK